ncbi:MAG: metallophosphoesterase [Bryobacteraceae bacterium]
MLARRTAIEHARANNAHRFRRHPLRHKIEQSIAKPMLTFALQIARLYARGVQNALSPIVRKIHLSFADLPSVFDGFQILQLSDLHIDGIEGLTEAVIEAVSDLTPDLCVLTGDYRFDIEGSCERAHSGMRSIVGRISEKCDILGILGNHDPSETAYALEEMGVRVLINDVAEIKRGHASISFIGVDDPYDYKCDDLESALASIPDDKFKILLAHAPELYDQAAEKAIHLYLCGHTHGGQIRIPWVGPVIRNSACPRSYSHGYWRHKGMQGYTSAGIGCSTLPVRFNCPPEIVLIELRVVDEAG